MFHKKTTKTHVIVLTESRLIDAKKKGTTFSWTISYENITSINLAKEGLIVSLDPPQV